MTRYLFTLLASIFLLTGCGTVAFTPTEYPLRDGLIPTFDVAGEVAITNIQTSSAPAIVYSYAGSKFSSDLKTITEVMVQQAVKELRKNSRKIKSKTKAPKSIKLKVNSLLSKYIAFFWKSNIQFEATLGDGQVVSFRVPHSSGVLQQDLNGCIAEGVLFLLKDEQVRSYLAK
ncbi:hypothetical protein [Nevskia sp.]|uniref:hypothetical protein n=1 Tax=Nevskia sp. TaxID=1929292 RepID=UPI0025CBE9F7|nr:hypothetical protein [Nevskia sp.]